MVVEVAEVVVTVVADVEVGPPGWRSLRWQRGAIFSPFTFWSLRK